MKSGIYKIVNTKTGKIYIGSAQNIKCRFGNHLSELRRGVHHSIHLQNSYNKSRNNPITKHKMAIAKLGKKFTEDHKNNMRLAHQRRKELKENRI
jgi:predicted GIY-YIG superfamily endonuclease